MPEPSSPETYRFGCTCCGDCCRAPGVVELSIDELDALGRFLGQGSTELLQSLPIQWSPKARLFELAADNGCPLLESDGRCSVEPVKPSQCRSYPFWPELTRAAATWRKEGKRCEGINHPKARTYARDEVIRIGRGERGT